MYYALKLKNHSKETIDRIQASSLEEARAFYIARKQMTPKQFDKLYIVEAQTEN